MHQIHLLAVGGAFGTLHARLCTSPVAAQSTFEQCELSTGVQAVTISSNGVKPVAQINVIHRPEPHAHRQAGICELPRLDPDSSFRFKISGRKLLSGCWSVRTSQASRFHIVPPLFEHVS